ncbi:hypothetical protein ACFCV8_10925 [Streptomyces sp. NPDC056347]|uniref:hypothetical protein n=1 Tax=Streptomyces sp. NPDC056347 TaxID=3345790 RepID=UPI0035DC7F44
MTALDVVNNTNAEVPLLARAVFLLGAPVSVTAQSCWEPYRLRTHHGLTVRSALGRPSVGGGIQAPAPPRLAKGI